MEQATACSLGVLLAVFAGCRGAVSQDAPASRPTSKPDYDAHVRELEKRLPTAAFGVVVEPPFVVVAEGGPAVAKRWAESTVRWAVRKLKQEYFERDPDTILDIWLFDGAASYRRYTRQVFDDTPTTPYGYYSSTHGALIMNIATGGGTLVHEIVHPYVAANFAGCPAWLNEGLGSLYEQSAERNERIVGLTNWRLAGLQEAIREERTVPLPKLFATTSAQFYGNGSGLHYAEARYLLFWLQREGKLKAFWHAFRQAHAEDPTGLATFQKVAGVTDVAAFQREWEKFVLGLDYR